MTVECNERYLITPPSLREMPARKAKDRQRRGHPFRYDVDWLRELC